MEPNIQCFNYSYCKYLKYTLILIVYTEMFYNSCDYLPAAADENVCEYIIYIMGKLSWK